MLIVFHPPDMHYCKEPGSISFTASSWVWQDCFQVLPGPPASSWCWRIVVPSAFPHRTSAPTSDRLGGPLLKLLQFIDVLRGLRLDVLLQIWSNKCWVKGNRSLGLVAVHLLIQPRITWPSLLRGNISGSYLACCLPRLAGHFQLLPSQSVPSACTVYSSPAAWLCICPCWMLNSLSVSTYLWMIALPSGILAGLPNLVSSANCV